jgi:hypothetical protein
MLRFWTTPTTELVHGRSHHVPGTTTDQPVSTTEQPVSAAEFKTDKETRYQRVPVHLQLRQG